MSYDRRFNRLDVGFWTRQRAALSTEGKLLASYLRTSPHTRAGGLLRLPLPYAARDVGLTEGAVGAALAELATAGDIVHDTGAELVALLDWPLHDSLDNAGAGLRAARNVLGEHRLAPGSEAVAAALRVLLPELRRVLDTTRGGREREALAALLPEVEAAAGRPSADGMQTVSGPSADPGIEDRGSVRGSLQSQRFPSNNAGGSAPASPGAVSIPLKDGTAYSPAPEQLTRWAASFPGVDVRRELLAAGAWCDAKPERKKTRRGAPAFCVNWLKNAKPTAPTRPAPPARDAAAARLAREAELAGEGVAP